MFELPEWTNKITQRAPRLEMPLRVGFRFAERWDADHCPLMAAAMAFFGLLSLFPLILAAVAILGRSVAGSPQVLEAFHTFVAGFFPGASRQIINEISAVGRNDNATTLGIVAIASLVWSGRAYFDTLASVLNSIWPGARPRSFWRHQLALWSLFGLAGLLWLFSTAATIALSTLQSFSARLPNLFWNRAPYVWTALGHLVSWLLTLCLFLVLYRFLPNVQSRRRKRVIWGAAVAGSLGWELAKWFFSAVISHNLSRYQTTYGSVAGVVLTMLWMYFSSLILLFGAEAAAVYEEIFPQLSET